MHRLLDVLPVFAGDERIITRFTLVPGSDFDVDALAALERSGARNIAWEDACRRPHDLILTASPKGPLRVLSGPLVLFPHGAGFNKTLAHEGSWDLPSGLDPRFLLDGGNPWAALHALAHTSQLDRLAEHCAPAATKAAVVGDPTLDRILRSLSLREEYRSSLGTGERRLIVLTSTWGPESLLARRPRLPAALVGGLPRDTYQFALVLHPNEYSRTGAFDLSRQLAPALEAGLVLARPHEEWAALLVASDAVITDHGSTALYAAAINRTVVGAYDGGSELIPGSPMAKMLAAVPLLSEAAALPDALQAATASGTRRFADTVFALRGRSLVRLRHELYRLLRLRPRSVPIEALPLPHPSPAPRRPPAYAVRAEVSGHRVSVQRFPAFTSVTAHHLAVEHPAAGPRHTQSASLLWRRSGPVRHDAPDAAATGRWTAAGWTARVLAEAPGCRTAAAILTPERCLVRHRSAGLLSVHIGVCHADGRVLRVDPAAVLSAVHAWLADATGPTAQATLACTVGPITVEVRVTQPDEADLGYEL
ncbi:translation initiation factor 2 [Kitasatospora sp. MAP12-15]|uniref:translation initiation factor 2 n=1 Tax=unclassified Kitasatospora TaxID=2633591 RepID=UPI00247EA58D|nr:hypothetical protein [Kitasatospora sp. MAP12-44]